MLKFQLLTIFVLCVTAQAGSSDDRFVKKYAMMKIYESCFGSDLVKQIRHEMKEAYAKCSAAPSHDVPSNFNGIPPVLLGKLPPGFTIDPDTQTITKPTDGVPHNEDNDLSGNHEPQQPPQKTPSVAGLWPFRHHGGSFSQQPSAPPYMLPPSVQFRPFSQATPFYQYPYNTPNIFYPTGPQYNPYAYQQYQQYYQPPYFGSNRMGRNMDLRDRLDLISRGPSGVRVKNITCVMQELGYIDHNLEPNYESITKRISNLPVPAELKGDIQDGLQFCQKFSQCVPDIRREVHPLSQELMKPMFFFRCYKHKKLEACIMKDIRERFTSEDELETDTDFRSLSRSGRSLRDDPLADPRFEALDEMTVYLYDYLSGGSSFDFDLLM